MSKYLQIGSCAILLLFVLGADEPANEHKTLAISGLAAPLVIDGKLDDWPKKITPVEMALDPEDEQYRGTAQCAWDAQYLYVAFKAATGKGLRNAGDDPATAFKTGDTVEVFLSVNKDPLADRKVRPDGSDTAKEGDYRVLMTRLRNTKPVVYGFDFVHPGLQTPPQIIRVSGPLAHIDAGGIIPEANMAVADAKIGDLAGFIVEARLPWRYFRDYKPAAGARLLFNLAINFSNSAGTLNIGKAYWNGPSHMCTDLGVESQIHPENWGWLELGKLPK